MKKEETKKGLQFNLESDNQLTRIAANFFQSRTDGEYSANDVSVVKDFFYHTIQSKPLKKYKVAFLFICVNDAYWQYMPKAIEGAKQFFLPDHNVDYFIWTDLPKDPAIIRQKIAEGLLKRKEATASMISSEMANVIVGNEKQKEIDKLIADLVKVRNEANIFEVETIEWPMPTLMRYHTFLQQEEKLQEYDYIFYCDVDMVFANYVGDEILGKGITAALHPMYALRHNYVAPFEPNPESAAYVPFDNKYYAGGFQGGKAKEFIKAMKEMKKTIDKDFEKGNYIAIWNDESHWNKYLRENPPSVVLSPAYIYPDSLIDEYYVKIWGRNYSPKLITLTKKFTVSKEGGDAIREQMKTL